jgi:hypothetical protein
LTALNSALSLYCGYAVNIADFTVCDRTISFTTSC